MQLAWSPCLENCCHAGNTFCTHTKMTLCDGYQVLGRKHSEGGTCSDQEGKEAGNFKQGEQGLVRDMLVREMAHTQAPDLLVLAAAR